MEDENDWSNDQNTLKVSAIGKLLEQIVSSWIQAYTSNLSSIARLCGFCFAMLKNLIYTMGLRESTLLLKAIGLTHQPDSTFLIINGTAVLFGLLPKFFQGPSIM